MSFGMGYSSKTDIDFGETSLENIFIKHFLPFADEDQLKVYILGLFYAKNNSGATISSLSEHLSITEEKVISALEYWEKSGLVSIEKTVHASEQTPCTSRQTQNTSTQARSRLFSDEGFHIKFHSARSQIFSGSRKIESEHHKSAELAKLVTSIKKKSVSSAEYSYYEDFVSKSGGAFDILETVLALYYRDLGGSEFAEVRKFLDYTLQNNIGDLEQTALLARNFFMRNDFYKRVKLLIGGKSAATPAEQTMINSWLDEYHMSETEILRFIEEHSPDTNNPTVGFINKAIIRERTPHADEDSQTALFARLKLEITGSRYAVNKSEKRIMAAWFGELGLSESEVDEYIAKYSATQRGATVSFIDSKIRGTNEVHDSKTQPLKVRNKKASAEPFENDELEKMLLARKNKNKQSE